ncbi:MAG: Gfo/Idh/MocA family oxidoreductase, partial [Chloroflexia bacterium]
TSQNDDTTANRTRYAVCGLSNRAIGTYIPALTGDAPTARHAELVALLDVDRERVRAYAQTAGLQTPAFDANGFDWMVAETAPDAVIVTTPDGAHAEYIVRALEAGLNVVSEKPMVIDCRQATDVVEAERNSVGTVRVTHNYRYTQAHMRLKRMILDGLLGRVVNVELAWNIDTYHGSSYFYRWNRDRAKSGGMSITKGCHHFDLVNWLLDDAPEQVFAYGALNYYGAKGPYNPALMDGVEYSQREQRDRDPYYRHWRGDAADAPEDDHLRPTDRGFNLPYNVQYPPGREMYIYDPEIEIEDTYSAVVRYRSGATMTYSANFSAPWEGYVLGINGTKGRIETTHYTAPSRCPFPATDQQPITYFPIFGERQIHETRSSTGGHGGADPFYAPPVHRPPADGGAGFGGGSEQGAYAVAVGEAVWRSATENRPITIRELLPISRRESALNRGGGAGE